VERAKSSAAVKSITKALSTKLGDSVGTVSQLGVQVEVEVLDPDAVSSTAEVLEALRAAIPGDNVPASAAEARRYATSGTRRAADRDGQDESLRHVQNH